MYYKNVAFVFARGGSKGIPNKNISIFCGKPLIQWTIELALKCNKIDKLVVSTDSLEIANVAKSFGADVPFLRPAELSDDLSPEISAWKHSINFLNDNNIFFDNFISLPCTSPLRNIQDIEGALELFNSENPDMLISVKDPSSNPYFNMIKIVDNRCKKIFDSSNTFYNRQSAPEVWDIATVIYIAKPQYILESKDFLSGDIIPFYIPKQRAIDIDDQYDFKFAEFLMSE